MNIQINNFLDVPNIVDRDGSIILIHPRLGIFGVIQRKMEYTTGYNADVGG